MFKFGWERRWKWRVDRSLWRFGRSSLGEEEEEKEDEEDEDAGCGSMLDKSALFRSAERLRWTKPLTNSLSH